MAERKSGPIKPPVIDLTARETAPEAETEARTDPAPTEPVEPAPQPEPVSPPAPAPDYLLLGAAVVAGGVLGAGLSLLLAYGGLFPGTPEDPRIGQIETRLAGLPSDNGGDTATRMAALSEDIAALKAAPTVDIAPLRQQLAALSSRVDAVAAGASGAEAEGLSQALTALGTRLDGVEAALAETNGATAGLRTDLAGLKQDISAQQKAAEAASARAQTMATQLPLVLAEFDAAIAAGRPYAAELASLRSFDPAMAVPERVAAAAERGVPRPEALVQGFRQILPAMASAIPTPENASWQDQGLGWLRNLLALRRTDEMAGDSPEAVLSRLEAAIERRDFAAAAPLFAQLPPSMLAQAGSLPADIATSADVQQFIATLRQAALQAAGTPETAS